MNRLISFVIAIVLLAGPLASAARADDGGLERLIVESADTPQEHAALASYYDGKAADARRLANHHRSMGKAYGGVKLAELAQMKAHCEKLAALYTEQAEQFEEMARRHHDLAK